MQEMSAKRVEYSEYEEVKLREKARRVLTAKTDFFKKELNVDYKRIRIGDQRTRWGSCSSKGTISYSWRLILMPEEIQDYVVVHELAHRREMNHSPKFWSIVASVLPDYQKRKKILQELGQIYHG